MKKILKLFLVISLAFTFGSFLANKDVSASAAVNNDWVIEVGGDRHYIYDDAPTFVAVAQEFNIVFETFFGSSGFGLFSLYKELPNGTLSPLYVDHALPHGEETITITGVSGKLHFSAHSMYYDYNLGYVVIDYNSPIITSFVFTIQTVEVIFIQGVNRQINYHNVSFEILNPSAMVSINVLLNGNQAVAFPSMPFDYAAFGNQYIFTAEGLYYIEIYDIWGGVSVYTFVITSSPLVQFTQGGNQQTVGYSVAFITSPYVAEVSVTKNGKPAIQMGSGNPFDYAVFGNQYIFTAGGYYFISVKDIFGELYFYAFTIDLTGPTVYFNGNIASTTGTTTISLLQSGGLTVTFNDNYSPISAITATYEYNFGSPIAFTNGQSFTAIGYYVIKVTDSVGNTTTVSAFLF